MMPLDLLREPLREALKRAETALSALSKTPDDERLLTECRSVIGEAIGALHMVGHAEGLKLCAQLDQQLADAETRADLLLETELESTLKRVRALRRALRESEATRSQPRVAVARAPETSEADVIKAFFVSWGSAYPGSVPEPFSADQLADQRRRFERGLLKVLQTGAENSALLEMSEALLSFGRQESNAVSRGFWHAAAALLVNWHDAAEPLQLPDKRICAALNSAMRRSAASATSLDAVTLKELYAAIGSAKAANDVMARAQAICSTAQDAPLIEYEDVQLDDESRTKCLEALSVLRDALERLEIGEAVAASDARRAGESLIRRAERTGVAALSLIARNMFEWLSAQSTLELGSGRHGAAAQAILLLEATLRKPGHLSSDHLASIEAAARKLVSDDPAVLRGAPRAAARLPNEYVKDALAAACGEARLQLTAIEATLEQFFAEPEGCRQELSSIPASLDGVQIILEMLGTQHSNATIDACRSAVMQCANDSKHDTPEHFAHIADCVVELIALVDIVELGQAPGETPYPFSDGAASEVDVALITATQNEPLVSTPLATTVSSAAPESQPPVEESPSVELERANDPELLGIFLEEAREVLAAIATYLPRGIALFDDKDAATEVRRAFHTLKGSGRMVGLDRFGAAAWSVESALNRFLENGRGLPQRLSLLIECAHQRLSDCITQFATVGSAAVDSGEIEALASKAEMAMTVAEETQTCLQRNGAETDADVEIGDSSQDAASPKRNPALWTIFESEAAVHIATLRASRSQWERSDVKFVTPDLVRAAHTLASTSGTMGILPLHELGRAFEIYLDSITRIDSPMNAEHVELALRAIAALERMVSEASQGLELVPESALIEELSSMSSRYKPRQALESGDSVATTNQVSAPSLIKRSAAEEEAKARARRQFRPEDEIDEQLLPLFQEEAQELVPRIGVALRAWRERPDDAALAQELQRHFHTLKGSARMAGVMGIGELLHSMETRTEHVQRAGAPDGKWFDQLEGSFDRLQLLLDRVGKPTPQYSAQSLQSASSVAPSQTNDANQEFAVNGVPLLRVRADLLERVTSKFTELSISQARGESLVKSLASAMQELDSDFEKLREHLRELEIQAESSLQAQIVPKSGSDRAFDPLELDRFTKLQELTRAMAESLEDFSEMQHQLRLQTNNFGRAYNQQSQVSRELQREFTRMRLMPFSSIAERLHRVVRQSAKELGKRANLDIHGFGTEIDRIVLERITAPLEHLLRNAVVHGLEDEGGRLAAGKSVQGEIKIEVRQSHGETLVTLRDDGAGLNWARIHSKAVEQQLLAPEAPLNPAVLSEFIFSPGFSTAETLTQLAGRGVGLDVVRSEVKSLGGDVRLESRAGAGTSFTLHLPLTLALLRVVIVMAGSRTYALPASMIDHVQSLNREAFEKACKARGIEWKDRHYELCYLPQLLGYDNVINAQEKRHTVLLLRSAGDILAVSVDGIVGNREIVTKPLAKQLAHLEGVSGAALLSTGEIALVLNPLAVRGRVTRSYTESENSGDLLPTLRKRSVLVVDDSVTVRKITSRLLTREGFEVHTAKNGLEALEQLSNAKPDVMLVDVEMPQMDGFELTRTVRGSPEIRDIPIIMITSRTTDKHRQHALDLGVNVFLGKPYTEKDLLSHIDEQLQRAA